jgi:hypothetical protein
MVLSDEFKYLLGIIRAKGWSDLFALDHKFNEPHFVFAVVVEIEPMVLFFGAETPFRANLPGIFHRYALEFFKEDGLGGRKWEVVPVDDNHLWVDDNMLVFVENLAHLQ